MTSLIDELVRQVSDNRCMMVEAWLRENLRPILGDVVDGSNAQIAEAVKSAGVELHELADERDGSIGYEIKQGEKIIAMKYFYI